VSRLKFNEKGAASVLVMFMMLVLVTLSAFAVASANANYRLSRRVINWNAMYYELDAEGELYLALVDAALIKAENAACDYNENARWESESAPGIPDELHQSIRTGLQASSFPLTLNEIFNSIYLLLSNQALNKMSLDLSNFNVYPVYKNDGFKVDTIYIEYTIQSDNPAGKNCSLIVTLRIEPALMYSVENGPRWNGGKRYKINDWYENQEEAGITFGDSEMGIWDGTLDF
jgi:hypothetical protein